MVITERKAYYRVQEVNEMFKIKSIKSTILKINTKDEFKNKWVEENGQYFIEKNLIDNILNDRELSMSTREAAVALCKSVDTVRDMINSKKLNFFKDKWDSTWRIYRKDIKDILAFNTDYYTAEDLASIFKISSNNIRKKIKFNYCNIKEFLEQPNNKKMYIKKSFITHLIEIDNDTKPLELVSKELNIRQQDLLNICKNINEKILVQDFWTGKWRIKNEYLKQLKNQNLKEQIIKDEKYIDFKFLLKEAIMTEEQVNNFAIKKCGLKLSDNIKNSSGKVLISKDIVMIINDKIEEYYDQNNEFILNDPNCNNYLSIDEMADLFGCSAVTMMKKVNKNYCNVKNYIIAAKKTLIKMEFLDHLRNLKYNTIGANGLAKECKISLSKLCGMYGENENIIFKDFLTSDTRIKKEYAFLIKKSYENMSNNEYQKLIPIKTLAQELSISQKQFEKLINSKSVLNMDNLIRKVGNKKYIHEDDTDNIKKKIKLYYQELEEDLSSWIDIKVVVKEFSVTQKYIERIINSQLGLNSTYVIKKIDNRIFLHIDNVEEVRKKIQVYWEEQDMSQLIELKKFVKECGLNKLKLIKIAHDQLNIDFESFLETIQKKNYIHKDIAIKLKMELDSNFYNKDATLLENIPINIFLEKISISKFRLDKILNDEYGVNLNDYITIYKENKYISNNSAMIIRDNIKKYYYNNYISLDLLLDELLISKVKFNKIITKNSSINKSKVIETFENKELVEKCVVSNITSAIDNYYGSQGRIYANLVELKLLIEKLSITKKQLYATHSSLKENVKSIKGHEFIAKNISKEILEQFDYSSQVSNLNPKKLQYIKILLEKTSMRYKILREFCMTVFEFDIENECYFFNGKKAILKEMADKIVKAVNDRYVKIDIDKSRYFHFDKAINILNISKRIMGKILSQCNNNEVYLDNKEFYINKEFINKILYIKENTISINQIANNIGINSKKIVDICRYEKIDLITNPIYDNRYVVKKEDAPLILKSKKTEISRKFARIRTATKNAKNEFETFDLAKEQINIKEYITRTERLFTQFSYKRISDTNGRESRRYQVARICANLLAFLNETLDKEIFYFNDNDILQLFSQIESLNYYKPLSAFLDFCKENINCTYSGNYTFNEGRYSKNDKEDEIYSPEMWKKFTEYLTNIDNHIIKAFSNEKYACHWLLCILHLVSTWRLNDYLTKIPNIDLESVGIIDFQWFYQGNEFTLSMGQTILNQLEVKLSGICADKNGQQLRLFYSIDLIVPLVVLYIIAEIHRRKNLHNKIFTIFLDSRFNNTEGVASIRSNLNSFFRGKEFDHFSNKKANSTLLTYLYECANTMEGMHSISYMLNGSMRSHKNNKDLQLPLATQIYLKPIINDENTKSISYNLLNRGFFGWLPYKLLQIIYDKEEFNKFDTNTITQEIVQLKQKYSLIGLENFANSLNLNSYSQAQIKVFNELIELDRDELRERIKSILTCESSAKTQYGGCLRGKTCAYPQKESCTFCEYFVKNILFLTYLSEEINEVLNKLFYLDINKKFEIMKYKNILYNLLLIITEAKCFYDEFDCEFVGTFIDIPNIKAKVKLVHNKFS